MPVALLKKYNKKPGDWNTEFGKEADEYFHAWSIATNIDDLRARGDLGERLP